MIYELKENILTAKVFLQLRESAGWGGSPKDQQIEAGLKNSLVTISAVYENQIIGMGRLVGDGFIICYIQDVIVRPEYQGKGIGKAIMKKLIAYAKNNGFSDTHMTIGLFTAKGKEGFYRKFGFVERPSPVENSPQGAGMILILPIP